MKKNHLVIGIIIAIVLCIGVGVTYKIIEKEVTDRETYDLQENENSSTDTVSLDEHSFFGKVVESRSTYIIVEPNADEEERKTSDKFRINLDNNNDMIHKINTNVKITYKGSIKENYPAEIETIKIEVKSVDSFELIFHEELGTGKKQIINKKKNKQYDYNVYIYNGKVDIVIKNKTYSLEKALKENKITMEEIIAKANQDIKNPLVYKDGGSIEYHYDNYTIIKFHSVDGNRDVYIGDKNLELGSIK